MKTEKQCYTVSPRNIQAAQKSSRVNFTDNRPQAIAQAKMINAIRSKTIQRQVCLLKPNFTDDFVENVSIDYALKRVGGPVQAFPASDFSAIPAGGNLYFVAHGAVGKAGDYSTTEIADRLTDSTAGLRHNNINIKFTCCHAGKDRAGVNTSVIDELKAKLNAPPITSYLTSPYTGSITGAKGPSIKSDETGDDFFVVGARPAGARFTAVQIQRKVESDFITSTLKPNSSTYITNADSKLTTPMSPFLIRDLNILVTTTLRVTLKKLIEDILSAMSTSRYVFSSPEEKAAFITAFTNGFYTQFKTALEHPAPIPPATATPGSFLLPPGSDMKTV